MTQIEDGPREQRADDRGCHARHLPRRDEEDTDGQARPGVEAIAQGLPQSSDEEAECARGDDRHDGEPAEPTAEQQVEDVVVAAFNFTPEPRTLYRIGVPRRGRWREIFNSDAREYGGSGHGNLGGVDTVPVPWNGRRQSINLTLPPLGAVFLEPESG